MAVLGILLCQTLLTLHGADSVPSAPTPVDPPASAAVAPEVTALAAARAGIASLGGTFRWLTGASDGTSEVRERVGTFTIVRGSADAATRYNVVASLADGSDLHRWCSDGIQRWHFERIVPDEQPTEVKGGGQEIDLDRVVACVLLDLPVLRRDFRIAYARDATGDGARLTFTPVPGAGLGDLQGLVVRLLAGQPQEVVVEVAPNTRIRLVITALKQDLPAAEVPARLFHPAPVPE